MKASASVQGLGIADDPSTFVTRAVERLELSAAGIEGDRHAGEWMKAGVRQKWFPRGVEVRNTRQLSILSAEELAEVAATLEIPEVDWKLLGANLCLRGVDQLTELPSGTRLIFPSGACVVVDGDNEPCTGPGKKVAAAVGHADPKLPSRFVKAAWGKRGLVGWVERVGAVQVGDAVEILLPRRPNKT